jgi:hypothetical protein
MFTNFHHEFDPQVECLSQFRNFAHASLYHHLRAFHIHCPRTSFVGLATGSCSSISRCMAARQRQCPILTFFRPSEHELLCGCSSSGMENGEPIWRLYPAAVSSLASFFERLIFDGRMAFDGIGVSFQLIHFQYLCCYVCLLRFLAGIIARGSCIRSLIIVFLRGSRAPIIDLITTRS